MIFWRRPYKHDGVWISPPPKLLGKMITAPGPLDQAAILRFGQLLDEPIKPEVMMFVSIRLRGIDSQPPPEAAEVAGFQTVPCNRA